MNSVAKEMKRVSDLKEKEGKKYADEANSAPCVVCGSKEFVQKFRNVVGEISGSMHGHFSLFGGSIHGHIDGYTKTLPVLSCRKCENEREIATWNWVHAKDEFWSYMHNFYFGFYFNEPSRFKDVQQFFLERPLETREYMIANNDYNHRDEMVAWDTGRWAKAGFKIPKVKKRYFFFWEREVYPSWDELKSNPHTT